MPLDRPLGPNPDIDIHGLAIPSPEKSSLIQFNPETDISSEDWQAMEKVLRTTYETSKYLRLAANMTLIFPDRMEDFSKKNFTKEDLRTHLEIYGPRFDNEFVQTISSINVVYPSLDYQVNDKEWDRLKSILLREKNHALNFVWYASKIKVAAYKRFSEEFKLSDEDREEYQKELYNVRKPRQLDKNIISVLDASRMRILFPSKFNSAFMNNFTDHEINWNDVRQEMINQNYPYSDFAALAAAMKILTAQDIKFTRGRLELIMAADTYKKEEPQLPEQRNF